MYDYKKNKNGTRQPLTRVVKNMEELVDLLEDITANSDHPGVGGMTIEFQLWFHLARQSNFFQDPNTA